MAHLHRIYDTDLHFIVNPITRVIASESGKVSLMQYDHNSERFTFEIPRMIEGHDMTLTDKVEVHYINGSGSSKLTRSDGIYPVDDLDLSPDSEDMVICSWLVSGQATKFAGNLAFVLRFVCHDQDGNITYQWFTNPFTGIKINAGINNENSITEGNSPDILELWKDDLYKSFEESAVYKNTLDAAAAAKASEEEVAALLQSFIDDGTFTTRGTYSSTTTYNILDAVSHNDCFWICRVDGTIGVEPSEANTATWQLALELTPITEEEIDAFDELEPLDVTLAAITIEELDEIMNS